MSRGSRHRRGARDTIARWFASLIGLMLGDGWARLGARAPRIVIALVVVFGFGGGCVGSCLACNFQLAPIMCGPIRGEPCPDGARCTGDQTCIAPAPGQAPRCTACGARGQPCCRNACNAGATCASSTARCVPCGREGERCCGGAAEQCETPYACESDPSGAVCRRRALADASFDTGRPARTDGGAASRAGAACLDDAQCMSSVLRCDRTVAGGFCTAACVDASPAIEEMACGGPGATCLTENDGDHARSSCTRSCRPSVRDTGCLAGQVCTGFWLSHARNVPDDPGCHPLCAEDRHCPVGQHCNVRTGVCDPVGVDLALLADGMPCVPPAEGEPSPCRGRCYHFGESPPRGICGSLVDLNVTGLCPDAPGATIPLRRAGDDLAYCFYRTCFTSCDCPSGLVCEDVGTSTNVCQYDDPRYAEIPCTGGGASDAGDGGDALELDSGDGDSAEPMDAPAD